MTKKPPFFISLPDYWGYLQKRLFRLNFEIERQKRHLAFKLTTTFHSQILLAFQQKSAWKTVKLSLLRSTGTRFVTNRILESGSHI